MFDVSVLTPSYGYGRFIGDCIESVLRQTDVSIEHVIQDGSSSDDTIDVLTSFGERVNWVSTPDHGQSDALNKALARAKGRWVAWLNADEFYAPDALASLIAEGERTGADVVYGDAVDVDESGKLVRLRPQHRFTSRILRSYGPFISSNAVVFRREILPPHPWDIGLKLIMDWDLYLQLNMARRTFHYLPKPIGVFRLHPLQESAHHKSNETTVVRRRYGISTRRMQRRIGRWLHGARKVSSGAYKRQRAAELLRGCDLRWFEDEARLRSFEDFHRRCYGDR